MCSTTWNHRWMSLPCTRLYTWGSNSSLYLLTMSRRFRNIIKKWQRYLKVSQQTRKNINSKHMQMALQLYSLLRCVLDYFDHVSRLRINFSKTKLVLKEEEIFLKKYFIIPDGNLVGMNVCMSEMWKIHISRN